MNYSGIKAKIAIVNLLQFAALGAWLVTIGAFLAKEVCLDEAARSAQINSVYAMVGVATLIMPVLMGAIADRWIQAQRLFGLCHFLAACFLVTASMMTTFSSFFNWMALALAFYMPTIALNNTVAFNALNTAELNPVKYFPILHMFGTVGFLAAMWSVDLCTINNSKEQLWVSAALSFIAGCASFAMPVCHVRPSSKKSFFAAVFNWKVLSLFKQKKMVKFFVFSMLVGAALHFVNIFTDESVKGLGDIMILVSIAMLAASLFILLMPLFFRRSRVVKVMLVPALCCAAVYCLMATGIAGSNLIFALTTATVYGIAFHFFNISGALYMDQEAEMDVLAGTQGLFMAMTHGLGAILGSLAAACIHKASGDPASWQIFAGYSLVIALAAVFILRRRGSRKKLA